MTGWWLPLWVAAAGAAGPLAGVPAEETPARYVIVVGHNQGVGDQQALRFADDDAARMYIQLLPTARRAWLLSTFDEGTAASFPDLTQVARPPSASELARVLGELNWTLREHQQHGERTELIFYFAGHGDVDPSGEGFLVMADGPFDRSTLQRQVVEGSLADVNHVILDACASYYTAPRGGDRAGERRLEGGMLDALRGADPGRRASSKTGILVSTSDASEVHESSALRGGVFSYLLRSALAGAADINGDGRVEYGEAAGFISAASEGLEDPAARLQVHARAPAQRPHAALTDLRTAQAAHYLVINGKADRHVRVVDSRGLPYAEVRSTAERVALTLVGSPYYVVQVGEKEAVLVPRRAGGYALSALSFEPASQPRSTEDPRYARFFSEPLSVSYLRGFLANSALPEPVAGPRFEVGMAEGYDEPFRIPWMWIGGSGLAVAGVAAAGAIVATGGNLLAFAALQQSYARTRYLDPDQALAVEVWRGAAVGLTAAAVLFALGGGATMGVGWVLEEGEP